jgi:hypothetical protein
MLFLFRLVTTANSRRGIATDRQRIIELCCGQVAFEEPAQVVRSTVEPELDATPVDGGLHLRWAREGQRYIRAAGRFFVDHSLHYYDPVR